MKHGRQILRAMRAGVQAGVWVLASGSAVAQGSDAPSTLGHEQFTATETVAFSGMTPDGPVGILLSRETWVQEQPRDALQGRSWGTGAGKSYLIPALEIPAFLLLLNRYDRRAYPDAVEDGK